MECDEFGGLVKLLQLYIDIYGLETHPNFREAAALISIKNDGRFPEDKVYKLMDNVRRRIELFFPKLYVGMDVEIPEKFGRLVNIWLKNGLK